MIQRLIMRLHHLVWTTLLLSCTAMFARANDCIHIGNPEHTDSQSKYEVMKPGHYCLVEDLHARIDFADHPSEMSIIVIRSSNVVLDLQGHTLGRGILFKNPGGTGITIADTWGIQKDTQVRNIRIKNGTLRDFGIGIVRDGGFTRSKVPGESNTFDPKTKTWSKVWVESDEPIYSPQNNTYLFPRSNIVLENIVFNNNKRDFLIHARTDASADQKANHASPQSYDEMVEQAPELGQLDDYVDRAVRYLTKGNVCPSDGIAGCVVCGLPLDKIETFRSEQREWLLAREKSATHAGPFGSKDYIAAMIGFTRERSGRLEAAIIGLAAANEYCNAIRSNR